MKLRLPKSQYLRLRDGGPHKIKGKPYSRREWKRQLQNNKIEIGEEQQIEEESYEQID